MTFKIFNTKIYVSYLFVSLFTLLLFLKQSEQIALCLLFSLFHEMGHIIMMKLCGGEISEIKFLPFGIAIKADDLSSLSPQRQVLILSAGVLVNLLLIPLNPAINIALIIFNLFPVGVLDGGRLLSLFIKSKKILAAISLAVLAVLLALSIKHQNPAMLITLGYLFLTVIFK